MDLKEKTLKQEYLYRGKVVNLRCDEVFLPNGRCAQREVLEHPGGACVLCVKDGKVVLVRQYRYPYGEELLEIPAGKLNQGEDPYSAAMRELKEETGLKANSLNYLMTFYPSPGYSNEKIYIYEAQETEEGGQNLDEDELLSVVYMPVEEALKSIQNGTMKDGKTIAALLFYSNRNK